MRNTNESDLDSSPPLTNTVLHGCESWALKNEQIRKFGVIRRIMGIINIQVEHDRIKNEHIRNFIDVADTIDTIRLCQFYWLGKLARQTDSLSTKCLLSAWVPAGHRGTVQFITLCTTYGVTLNTILGPVCMRDDSGYLNSWLGLAQSRIDWNLLGANFKRSQNWLLSVPCHWPSAACPVRQ